MTCGYTLIVTARSPKRDINGDGGKFRLVGRWKKAEVGLSSGVGFNVEMTKMRMLAALLTLAWVLAGCVSAQRNAQGAIDTANNLEELSRNY